MDYARLKLQPTPAGGGVYGVHMAVAG